MTQRGALLVFFFGSLWWTSEAVTTRQAWPVGPSLRHPADACAPLSGSGQGVPFVLAASMPGHCCGLRAVLSPL